MVERTFWKQRVERAWKHRSIVWLAGVRRVGKTVLSRSLPDVRYFDCDVPEVQRAAGDPMRFLADSGPGRFVFDEVHRLENPSRFLKLAADHFPDTRIVATGSSTLAATRKFSDSLTGRKSVVLLTPMMSADLETFGGNLNDRLWWGGLPPFFLGGEKTPASDFAEWMDSYWARDVQELFQVRQRPSFARFVELVLVNSGGMFEASWYASRAEASRPTISSYLDILDVTRVANVVRPYSTRKTTEIVSRPKVYAFDTGFVRHFKGWRERRAEDLGQLWEHYVLNELLACVPDAEIRYWRDKQGREVDFVVLVRGRPPIAVECKWSSANLGDLEGLRAFRAAYPDGPNFVVAPDVTITTGSSTRGTGFELVGLGDLTGRIAGE